MRLLLLTVLTFIFSQANATLRCTDLSKSVSVVAKAVPPTDPKSVTEITDPVLKKEIIEKSRPLKVRQIGPFSWEEISGPYPLSVNIGYKGVKKNFKVYPESEPFYDPRIDGLILVDPSSLPTERTYIDKNLTIQRYEHYYSEIYFRRFNPITNEASSSLENQNRIYLRIEGKAFFQHPWSKSRLSSDFVILDSDHILVAGDVNYVNNQPVIQPMQIWRRHDATDSLSHVIDLKPEDIAINYFFYEHKILATYSGRYFFYEGGGKMKFLGHIKTVYPTLGYVDLPARTLELGGQHYLVIETIMHDSQQVIRIDY